MDRERRKWGRGGLNVVGWRSASWGRVIQVFGVKTKELKAAQGEGVDVKKQEPTMDPKCSGWSGNQELGGGGS